VPLVAVICEAPEMPPEEVELLVTSTVESSLNGIARVQRQASVSRYGQAIIWIQFDRGMNIYQARQLVAGRLVSVELPSGVEARLGPPSFGEIFLVALHTEAASETKPRDELARELRDLADHALRRQLLAIPDVSQVVVTGGRRDEYHIVASPEHLEAFGVTLRELSVAIADENMASGVLDAADDSESILRGIDSLRPLEHIENIVVGTRSGRPVLVRDVAQVLIGSATDFPHRDQAAEQLRNVAVEPAVILAIGLRPDVDKSNASAEIDEVLRQLTDDLPRGVIIERKIDKQLDTLVSQTLQKLRRDLPPDMELIRRFSNRNGEFVVSSSDDRIAVKMFGPDLAVLHEKANEIQRDMTELAGVVDLRVEPHADEPRLKHEVDRERLEQLGLTVDSLHEAVNLAIGEAVVSQMRSGDRTYDLILKTRQSDIDLQRIADTPIRTPSGELVPLSLLVELRVVTGPTVIYHENMQRMVIISCAVEDRDRSDVESDIRRVLKSIFDDMEDGYYIEYGTQ
jgi:Cu/Ag efflux pump CusA